MSISIPAQSFSDAAVALPDLEDPEALLDLKDPVDALGLEALEDPVDPADLVVLEGLEDSESRLSGAQVSRFNDVQLLQVSRFAGVQ